MGVSDVAEQNIARQTLLAAANTPIASAGGVSQSSGSGANSATVAPVISITPRNDGATTFSISIPANNDVTHEFDTITSAGTGGNRRLTQEGSGAESSDIVGFTQILPAPVLASESDTGILYVYLGTDTPDSIGSDTDYLAYGFWIHDPVGTATTDIPEIGVFCRQPQLCLRGY